jgi:pimeloyl-ACP methyl ester carboxylesterase
VTTTGLAYKYVTLTHGKTRYIDAGAGDPVIFIHGAPFMRSADDVLPILAPLASRFRVLSPDCPGWPPSDQLDEEYSFAYITDFVREFQNALGIGRSHIIGASMGGWIANLLCYESPHRVDKAIVTGHNGVGARPNRGMVDWQVPGDDAIRNWIVRITKGSDVDVEAMVRERVAAAHDPKVVEAFGKIMRHMGDSETRRRYDVNPRLPYIMTPTLYVWGRTDASFPVAEDAHRLTPGSRLEVLECGHDTSVDAAEEFCKLALDFLA